eukprot:1320667-Rhodomonas_salina.1
MEKRMRDRKRGSAPRVLDDCFELVPLDPLDVGSPAGVLAAEVDEAALPGGDEPHDHGCAVDVHLFRVLRLILFPSDAHVSETPTRFAATRRRRGKPTLWNTSGAMYASVPVFPTPAAEHPLFTILHMPKSAILSRVRSLVNNKLPGFKSL